MLVNKVMVILHINFIDLLTGDDTSAAETANAAKPGKDVPGYQSNPAPKEGKIDTSNINVPKGYELKAKGPKEVSPEEEKYWTTMFGKQRGEACSGKNILRFELQKIGVNENGVLINNNGGGAKAGTGPFGWIKQWGFGLSAYFFDFLDPSLRPLHLEEFGKIWEKFKSYAPEDNSLYKDPFSRNTTIDTNLDAVSQKRQQEQIERLKEKIQTDVYNISINAVQLNQGIRENNWHLDKSIVDNAKAFIRKFDINQDGRMSPRELILGSIFHNKAVLGSYDCTLCYEDLVDKIDGIFSYIDCDDDGMISSYDIYKNIQKLRRDSSKWNFFALAEQATIRTAVTNDFVLKNMYTSNGLLTKPEFRMGILLGFWDRQTDNYGIVKDEKLNMKALRWKDDDVVDIGAMEYIKNKAEAEAEQKRKEMKSQADKNKGTDIEVSMAEE